MQLEAKDIANSTNSRHVKSNTAPSHEFPVRLHQRRLFVLQDRFSTARPVTRLPTISLQCFLETTVEVKHL